MRVCPDCQEEMRCTTFGDFDVHWYCSCDLTHVEGHSPRGVVELTAEDYLYSPFENEIASNGLLFTPEGYPTNDVSLVPALEASLRLCGANVPEPHSTITASAESA